MNKKVKTFEDKQRPLTQAEMAALEYLKGDNNKKIKSDVIRPDNVLLKDKNFEAKSDEDLGSEEGRLITEEDLKNEDLLLQEESERFSKAFMEQFNKWVAEDHGSEYEGIEFDHDDYLVRIFKMDVSGFKGFITLEYEWSVYLKNFKLKDKPATENLFPIVKILKKGQGIKSDKYKEGDVVLVPSNDILGEDWNPKFIQVMQYQDSRNMKPVLPEGMRQSIPNVEKNWDRYKFVRPWVPKPEEIDHLTYLIPETKVRGTFNVK